MRIVGFGPYLTLENANRTGIKKVELDEWLARADFITLHTSLIDATNNIILADALNKTKVGVQIIKYARGGLIDRFALLAALSTGRVASAALDVFANEPTTDCLLFGIDNAVATPHPGASKVEAQEEVASQLAKQMADFLINGAETSAVNMASVSVEESPILRLYLELSRKLGEFLGQVNTCGLASRHH